jgi:hypothetical protein
VLKAAASPGSRFKGCDDFLVQDLVLLGQVTVERLTTQLCARAQHLEASEPAPAKAGVMRLLIDRQDDFLAENRGVLRAGLQMVAWSTVDDTGAQHA